MYLRKREMMQQIQTEIHNSNENVIYETKYCYMYYECLVNFECRLSLIGMVPVKCPLLNGPITIKLSLKS